MSWCKDWEERIALHAGCDLTEAEAEGVRRHLAECAGCRVLSADLKQSLELLREAHEDPIAPAHLAAVRARVLAELARQRRPFWRRASVYAIAAAALVVLGIMLMPPPVRAPSPVAGVAPPSPPSPALTPPLVRPPVREVRRVHGARTSERHPRPTPPWAGPKPVPQPLLVKLITDDPNVIIYWIADRKGD